MAYARFGEDSDVYVFMSTRGLECLRCDLSPPAFVGSSTDEMITHLAKHREAGDRMPPGIEDDLREDDEENFGGSKPEGRDS